MIRVFANGPGDLHPIPVRVIPKTQKMVHDASLLNTQHYKVQIKGKVEQSRRRLHPKGLEFHVCTINKSAHMKKVWKFIEGTSYIDILCFSIFFSI